MQKFNDFLQWEKTTKDTIDFKKIYVDMAGDLIAGLMLSQIVFWHLPNKEGASKLRVEKNGKMWVAKQRADWYAEIRITPKQADRALKLLEMKGLIETQLYKFNGTPIKHIRVDGATFLKSWRENIDDDMIFPKGENPFSPKVENHFDERGKSLTENTTENTTESKVPSSDSANQDAPKQPLITYRRQLEGEQLEAFELIADNLEKVVGKTLIEFVRQSPEAVSSAFEETIERGKKHFNYFVKVFFSHLQGGNNNGTGEFKGTIPDYDNIDKELYITG